MKQFCPPAKKKRQQAPTSSGRSVSEPSLASLVRAASQSAPVQAQATLQRMADRAVIQREGSESASYSTDEETQSAYSQDGASASSTDSSASSGASSGAGSSGGASTGSGSDSLASVGSDTGEAAYDFAEVGKIGREILNARLRAHPERAGGIARDSRHRARRRAPFVKANIDTIESNIPELKRSRRRVKRRNRIALGSKGVAAVSGTSSFLFPPGAVFTEPLKFAAKAGAIAAKRSAGKHRRRGAALTERYAQEGHTSLGEDHFATIEDITGLNEKRDALGGFVGTAGAAGARVERRRRRKKLRAAKKAFVNHSLRAERRRRHAALGSLRGATSGEDSYSLGVESASTSSNSSSSASSGEPSADPSISLDEYSSESS